MRDMTKKNWLLFILKIINPFLFSWFSFIISFLIVYQNHKENMSK